MNNFPYPVLQDFGTGYKDECIFYIEYIKHSINNNCSTITFEMKLKSKTLENLLSNNKALIIIEAQTSIKTIKQKLSKFSDKVCIDIPLEYINGNECIEIKAVVILSQKQNLVFKDDIKDEYGKDFSIDLLKGSKLAISNTEKINYKTEPLNFIKLNPTKMIHEGFSIDLNTPNFIKINIPLELNKAYTKCKNNKIEHLNDLSIFSSNLVFETIVYTLIEILKDNTLKEKSWFNQFKYCFNSTGEDIEDFIIENSNTTNLQIDKIYELAHKITRNSISNALIKASADEE